MFPTHLSSVILWMALCHTVAIHLVALPFAYVIARLYGRVAVVLALAITFALYTIDPLPGLVWLIGRRTSNNRFERSRDV